MPKHPKCSTCELESLPLRCRCMGPREYQCKSGHLFLYCEPHEKCIPLEYVGQSHIFEHPDAPCLCNRKVREGRRMF
jgi:hypothetical protein